MGNFGYFRVTRLVAISLSISVVSSFSQSPCDSYWVVVNQFLRNIIEALGQELLYEDQGHKQIVGHADNEYCFGSLINRCFTSRYFLI